ncbi:MAG: Ig domain-containing protein [Abditibacteriota bacterium]|nr:Ig domain-containing protein [Abditibacteriota bacterium]
MTWNGATEITGPTTQSGKTYFSNTRDQNALLISNAGDVTINNATINKSYGSLQAELCRYYGINSAVVCNGYEKKCSVEFNKGTITATGAHAAGILCYYADAWLDHYTISSDKDRGVAAEVMSCIYLTSSKVTSKSPLSYCGALAAEGGSAIDFCEGIAEGLSAAPAIYCSTGQVSVRDSFVQSHEGPAIVQEAGSEVYLSGCPLLVEPESENPPFTVKIYNEAAEYDGTASLFSMKDGYVEGADMFYVTNAKAQIFLENTNLSPLTGTTFLEAGSSEYGTDGHNGADVELNMYFQQGGGDIYVDGISSLNMLLDGQSLFSGSINKYGQEGYVKVTVNSLSTWVLTDDSYISELDIASANNINLNGHTLYIDGVPFDPAAHVTGVTLDKTSVTLKTGETVTLEATVAPSFAADKGIIWQSYDTSIATVDKNGKVKGVSAGTTTIRAKTRDMGFTAKCKVTVKDPVIPVSGVVLDKTKATVDKGKTVTLTATVAPSNATDKKVTWSSYDTSIATVDANGKVKGIAPGTTTIRAKTKDGGFTAKCKVTVKEPTVPVTGVTLNKTSASVAVGKTVTLTAAVAPSDATDKNVTWQSYDKAIATVDANGKVKGIAPGTTTIRVKTRDGGFTAKFKVTVKESSVPVTGVTLNKTSATVETGGTLTLKATVKPSDAADKSVTWSSYDKSIATVSSSGKVTGIAPGTTTIRVKTRDGGFTAKCKVTVKDPVIPVTGVTLPLHHTHMDVGCVFSLFAEIEPYNATDQRVTWASSDPSIVEVNEDGDVTAMAPGTAFVRVRTRDGGFTDECEVLVVEPIVAVLGVHLMPDAVTLYSDGSEEERTEFLYASVFPVDATDQAVTWKSSDKTVAKVDANGKVTAVAPGSATVTVKTHDGGYTAKCKVTVK